jgi:hypothetical protein
MKMFKNILIVASTASFMFAGIGYHMANNYTGMDDPNGASVTPSYGVTYDLNGQTSVGYDSELGMMMTFDAPAGTSLRLGWVALVDASCTTGTDGGAGAWDGTEANCTDGYDGGADAMTSIGLGFTWWSGGAGLNTSISTNYDYVMQGTENSTNLSVVVGFGF